MTVSSASIGLPTGAPARPANRGVLRQMRKQWSAYLFLAPTMILFGIFTVAAVIYAFYLSFHEWNILEPAKPYVGLDNYSRLLGDERFGGAIGNTLYYTAASVPLTMGLGLLIALLLNNQIRARGFFRTLFYLPVVTPLVIAAIIWKWLYSGDFGLLNYYLIQLGIIDEPLLWLADPNLAMPAEIIIMTNGGPLQRTTTIVYHVYQTAFKFFDMGYASAMAFGMFAMMFAFTLVQLRVMRGEVEY